MQAIGSNRRCTAPAGDGWRGSRVTYVRGLPGYLSVEGRRPGMSGEADGEAGDTRAVISDADADALIAEAVRRRDEQGSGRSMGRQLPRVAGFALVGLALAAGGGLLGHALSVAAFVIGVFALAISGLFLLRALDLSPATQWGEPVGEPCPGCGERRLREDRVALADVNDGVGGIVALCTPDCGRAEVRPDPESEADSATRRLAAE